MGLTQTVVCSLSILLEQLFQSPAISTRNPGELLGNTQNKQLLDYLEIPHKLRHEERFPFVGHREATGRDAELKAGAVDQQKRSCKFLAVLVPTHIFGEWNNSKVGFCVCAVN